MDPSTLRAWLTRAGPQRTANIRSVLQLPPSSFLRLADALKQDLIRLGRARATTWGVRRTIDGVQTPLPVYDVDATGAIRHALTLHPVEPFGYAVTSHSPDVDEGFFEADPRALGSGRVDLPWYLQDLRPDGFVGRAWVRSHPTLGYPADLARWTGDDTVRWLAHHGVDTPGAWLVGDLARAMFEELQPAPVPIGDVAAVYPERARQAMEPILGGSSPGGEQPKFTVQTIEPDGHVRDHLVKFSPPVDSPGGRRWADLLVAEHVAGEVLREHGVAAARSRIVDAGGRRFLQVERFDRHGLRGRTGLISLLPFDRAGVGGDLRRWSLLTAQLVASGRLTLADHDRVEWLESFGQLIANTDMHPGNLSLRLRGTVVLGLAPVYDMLPMFHAPRHGGELPTGRYGPRVDRVPDSARAAAARFWDVVASHCDVSAEFQAIALDQRALV